jgi:hypothetical protein
VHRLSVSCIALLAVVFAALPGAATNARPRGPFLLVALNSLGEVRWFCAAGARPNLDEFALQYTQARVTATTLVRLVVGGRTIKKATTNPGAVVRFPFLRPARQRLVFVQSHEPGTLTAVVDVDFGRHYRQPFYSACWSYMPPPVNASIRFRPSG